MVKTMKHIVKSIAIGVLIVWLQLIVSGIVFSSEFSAKELLKKAYKNQCLVSHTGTLRTIIFLRDKPPHKKIPNERPAVNSSLVKIRQKNGKMRMDYKSGHITGISIIDDGRRIMHLDRRNRTVIVKPIPFSRGDISLLLSNYEVISKGMEKTAGRQTQIIQLKPRHTGNPSKRLWVDIETFMPLKREYYNSDGMLKTRSFYTKINYDARIKSGNLSPPEDWQVIKPPQKIRKFSKKQISETTDFDIVEPKYVPAGYVLDGFYRFQPPPPRRGKGVHIRYVDGLNSISVFEVLPHRFRHGMGRIRGFFRGHGRERKHRQDKPRCKMLDNHKGKAIRITKGDLNVVIIGDMAESELQKVADSIR